MEVFSEHADSNLSLVTPASRKHHMPGTLKVLNRDMKVSASWDRTMSLFRGHRVCQADVFALCKLICSLGSRGISRHHPAVKVLLAICLSPVSYGP
ncbi:uncharacterized [Tachysurus ichikawai]